MLPPGRLRLGTRPTRTGSLTAENTTGMVRVRSFSSERRGGAAGRKQGGHAQVNEFGRQNRQPVVVALRPAKGDHDILPLDESRCTETLPEGCHDARGISGRTAAEKPDHRHRRLLRARCERPHRRAAEQRDELTSPHSITSSARASNDGGTVRPSVLAALRLITSTYLVGACTGRLAGFSPLRMRST